MRGIVTRHREELAWPAFDRGFFELKRPSGHIGTPATDGINLISCFGDTAATRSDPDLAARTEEGRRATPDDSELDRGFICPTRDAYRDRLLALVEEAAATSPDIRLDDIGFPGAAYCQCASCEAAFERSAQTDREGWRADVVTDFVAEAADRVPGKLYVGLYPDPYPGHLVRRSGIDLESIGSHVDEFVVPLYDPSYETTYWVEILAEGFRSRLSTPLGVELFAGDATVDALDRATRAAEPHADHVYYGYDAGTAQALVRRERASANEGVEHR